MNMKISSKRSVLALANSIEVATGVVHELVGNSLAKRSPALPSLTSWARA